MLFPLGDFLKKATQKFRFAEDKKRFVIEAVFLHTGITIKDKDISFQRSGAFLSVSPGERATIFMKKSVILSTLRDKGIVMRDLR